MLNASWKLISQSHDIPSSSSHLAFLVDGEWKLIDKNNLKVTVQNNFLRA